MSNEVRIMLLNIVGNYIITILFTFYVRQLQSNKRHDKFNYIAVTILTSAPSVKISYFRGFINYHRRVGKIYGNESGWNANSAFVTFM